jgi:hypothetical protein
LVLATVSNCTGDSTQALKQVISSSSSNNNWSSSVKIWVMCSHSLTLLKESTNQPDNKLIIDHKSHAKLVSSYAKSKHVIDFGSI